MNASANQAWPPLPFGPWQATCATLHMWTQIVGKTRLALAPMLNHWWQVTLYLTPRGLTTSPIPFGDQAFAVDFDFVAHELTLQASTGTRRTLPLAAQPVADFYRSYMGAVRALGIDVTVMPVPVEVVTAIPFAEDYEHAAYDAEAVHRWWQALLQADRVLKEFRSRFLGKASPVQFFWGSFDLASTRFSGRRAPRHPGGAPNCPDYVMVEAYSHECSSCGFWAGSDAFPEPAFYSYTYPEPAGYAEYKVEPEGARYNVDLHEFVLPYEVVRTAPRPDEALFGFLQSTYDAAAALANWDRTALERPREAPLGARG